MTAAVFSWSSPEAQLPEVAGTKVATLVRLAARGFRVPTGFVLTTGARSDGQWRQEVTEAYRALGGPSVAVRSSATDEDLPGRSAAGLYRTVLDVTGTADVLAAVQECLLSADSAHRQAYGTRGTDERMAVGVMVMVRPDVSGVAFSTDPLGSGSLVIEAVRGPLEPLVSGRVVPHHVALDATDAVVVDEPGDDGPGVLDLRTARAVARLVRAVAAELGGDVDVEWALDDEGLAVLQARPALVLGAG